MKKPSQLSGRLFKIAATSSLCLIVASSLATNFAFAASKVKNGAANTANTEIGPGLVAQKPLPLVTGPKVTFPNETPVPVVDVSFTSAVLMKKPTDLPTSLLAPIAPQVAKRLAAYIFPINQWDFVCMIGPRGMKGTAQLATDGGMGVTLTSRQATLEFTHVGGSPLMADGLAASLFPAAGKAVNQDGIGAKWTQNDLLHHAAIAYFYDHRVAVFAFQNKDGRSVYGYGFYQHSYLGAFSMASQFIYASTKRDADLAPYVMASALSTLTAIGEPQLSGTIVPVAHAGVRQDGRVYQLAVPEGLSAMGMVVSTPKGTVWTLEPTLISTGNGLRPEIPSGPFLINISPRGTTRLTDANARTLAMVAPYRFGVFASIPWYANVHLLQPVAKDWLLYSVTYVAVGMNQPAQNDLYAVNLQAGANSPTLLTSFQDAGGFFFFVGSYGTYVIYDSANDLIPSGNMAHDLEMVDLQTGQRTHLSSSDLHNNVVTVTIGGQRREILLQHD